MILKLNCAAAELTDERTCLPGYVASSMIPPRSVFLYKGTQFVRGELVPVLSFSLILRAHRTQYLMGSGDMDGQRVC
jgi:hypothetical protein